MSTDIGTVGAESVPLVDSAPPSIEEAVATSRNLHHALSGVLLGTPGP